MIQLTLTPSIKLKPKFLRKKKWREQENLDEDTEIVTMLDVLNEETELENNADAGKSKIYLTLQCNIEFVSFLQF